MLIASIASGAFIDKVLEPKWFVLLGQSSFALYMFHVPLLIFASWLFANRVELGPVGHLVEGCDRRLMLSVVSVGRSSTHRETPKVLVSLWLRDTEIFRISNSALKPQPLNKTSSTQKMSVPKENGWHLASRFFNHLVVSVLAMASTMSTTAPM